MGFYLLVASQNFNASAHEIRLYLILHASNISGG